MLDTSALKEFESLLGPRNVSDDPAVVTGYGWNTGYSGGPPTERLSPVKPAAILLPGSTEEVQAIVKVCLRHGLRFKPQSTGHMAFGNVSTAETVALDLRRMDRIIELDADNQMAVIEPYVTVGDLMFAAMKKGLTSHSVGAGWTHSPLASATSLMGIGIAGNHTGQNSRNLLAYEWVTPQGEIVRGGSAGCGAGWYAGEGPGPGYRGMIRGHVGAGGALGIFTRIGYKLHPWDGPPVMEHYGAHPNYGLKLDPNQRVYQCVWQDWGGPRDAMYELMASKAATFVIRIPADQYGWTLALSNRDYYDQRRAGTLPEIAREENRISWTLMTVSASDAESSWRERTIRAIVEKTSGRILDLDPHHEAMIARNIVTSCYVPRALRGGLNGSGTSFGISDSFALLPKFVERGEDMMRQDKRPGGAFVEGDPEQFWIWPNEGRNVWAENIVPADTSATGPVFGHVLTSIEDNDRQPIGNSAFLSRNDLSQIYGPGMGHFDQWMRKIKTALDPTWAADGDYIGPTALPVARYWGVIRHFMFRSRRLLGFLIVRALTGKK